jgi:biotin carboxyl carrier protein
MRLRLELDGREQVVEVGPAGAVILGDQSFQTTVAAPTAERRLVQVGDKTYDIRVVEAQESEGRFTLEVAGERVPLRVLEVVRESGGSGEVGPVGGAALVGGAAAGAAEASDVGGRGGAGAGGGSTAGKVSVGEGEEGVSAPVPGKVVNVLVAVGDMVEEGQALLVLEAMKMENELRAPRRGKVSRLLVAKGDMAEKGQLLVVIR